MKSSAIIEDTTAQFLETKIADYYYGNSHRTKYYNRLREARSLFWQAFPISMKFGTNVLGTKAMCIVRVFNPPPTVLKWRMFFWVFFVTRVKRFFNILNRFLGLFCNYGQTPWHGLIPFRFVRYIYSYKTLEILELSLV